MMIYLLTLHPIHYASTIIIIAIKTALWQFSKNSYCVLVHGPRLKSKKLTKCDSRKLKFHTKPHNNHDTFNTCLFRHLYLYKYMHMKEDHEGKRSSRILCVIIVRFCVKF